MLVGTLVIRGSFHRVEHILLLLSTVFVAYVGSAFLAHPDWRAAARGAVVPSMPLDRNALIVVAGVVGTTLAPWGLAFIQSYAADKKLTSADLSYERVDVISGALLTGIIGAFIVIACAATLHESGRTDIDDARDAAIALRPLAGSFTSALFGAGFSAPRSWRPPLSRSPRRTRWPSPSGASAVSTTAFATHPSSTGRTSRS